MATEVTHIGNTEAHQLDSVPSAVFCAERVPPVETFLSELVTHELAGGIPIFRYSTGKLIDKKSW